MLNTQANTLICKFSVSKMLPVLPHTFVCGLSSVFLQEKEPAEGDSGLQWSREDAAAGHSGVPTVHVKHF